ncbi:hypothetical protein B0H16DRAFT_658861 [Mycena metata]|uniref:Uncharacterized protein n=1 Tax=Mycena metata TaxID=1033252 RepID=A0AAD7NF37_9AGAR|nr:hypothetical protein B0H16DRAFT_658861 [Mycena metata]
MSGMSFSLAMVEWARLRWSLSSHSILGSTYDPTIFDGFRKQFVVDNRMCFLKVIDTAGQEEYVVLLDEWIRALSSYTLSIPGQPLIGSRSSARPSREAEEEEESQSCCYLETNPTNYTSARSPSRRVPHLHKLLDAVSSKYLPKRRKTLNWHL